MIKANELRIGNYVQDKEAIRYNYREVTGVYKKSNGEQELVIDFHYPIDYFEPIPLTEQWLLDLGGIDNGYEIVIKVKNIRFVFNWGSRIVSTGKRLNWYCKNYPNAKYIHHLQNLCHALTGQELTLKENK